LAKETGPSLVSLAPFSVNDVDKLVNIFVDHRLLNDFD